VRRKVEAMRKKVTFLTSIFLLQVLVGCSDIQRVSEDVFIPVRGAGQLILYFKPIARSNVHVSFQLDSIETETSEGQRIVLSSKVVEVNSRKWLDQQIKLAEVSLTPNSYKGIEFKISKAFLEKDEEKITLNIPEGVIRVSGPFQVYSRESTPLFIEWNVDRSIESEVFFKPVMSFFSKEPQLKSLMIYVTQERSNNVVVINRNTDQIVSTIEVGKKPHGIALQSDINRVYVANSGEDTITIIDTQTNRVLNKINTRLAAQPEDIAVSSDGRLVIITYFATNEVSVRETTTLRELGNINVDKGPIRVVIDPRGRKAFISNYYSNTVTVIDLSLLKVIGTIPVESKPIGMAFNARGDRLYVINSEASNISVIDPVGQTVIGRINIGTGGYGVIADSFGDRIFVTRSTTNQFLFVNAPVNTITKFLQLEKKPTNLDVDPDGKKIYVINQGANSLSVINKIMGTVEKRIGIGEYPYDIAIAQ
jgi:YVTN family beta-propeller protein